MHFSCQFECYTSPSWALGRTALRRSSAVIRLNYYYYYCYYSQLIHTVLNTSETQTAVCLNCVELYNVYWRQNAGTHSSGVSSHMSISVLSSWPCHEDFFLISKASYPARQNTSPGCVIFHFCLFRFKMLPVSFEYYWCPSSYSQFQKLLSVCHL